jgi:hypothetical protein
VWDYPFLLAIANFEYRYRLKSFNIDCLLNDMAITSVLTDLGDSLIFFTTTVERGWKAAW